jgi:fibronectin type 3 domain-containing protein
MTTPAPYAIAQDAHVQKSHGGRHSFHLSWQGPQRSKDKVAGYNIYRSADGGKKFRKLNEIPVPQPEYDDTTVRRGKTYLYRVKSVDAMGVESGPSNEITLKMP